jgi:hypothetical protein
MTAHLNCYLTAFSVSLAIRRVVSNEIPIFDRENVYIDIFRVFRFFDKIRKAAR